MVTLENLEQHTIPFDQFELKWRFTEEKYNVLPAHHLAQIRPLDKEASKMLNDLTNARLDVRFLLDPSQFKYIRATHIPDNLENEQIVKKWLCQRGLPFDRKVYVSWHPNYAVITTWKMMVEYWSDFWYPSSDDVVVVDMSLNWALAIFHQDYIQFGTNKECNNEICENELVGTDTL